MSDKLSTHIKPYIPIWNRDKNKVVRYETRPFDDGVGHTAQVTYVIFLDKNKKEQEMVAYVKWDKL